MKSKNIYISIILTFTCLFIYSSKSYAQSSKTLMNIGKSDYKHQFGFNGCSMMGAGVTYRYTQDNSGIQFTLLPIYTNGDYFIMVSGSYLHKIHRTGPIEFGWFGSLGAAFVNESNILNLSTGIQTTLKLGQNLDLDIRNGFSINTGVIEEDTGGLFSQGFGLGLMYNFTRG